MIYLDYCATTPVNKEVLDTFCKVCKDYPGNTNSMHKLGVDAKELMNHATEQIASLLHVKATEIIYTSGASESNNTALKGIALRYKNRGKHIITTQLEHSSIFGPLNFLQEQGFEVDFVKIKKDGSVDLEHLKSLMKDTTILVSICAVDSEIGLRQPVEEIGTFLKKEYPKCFFHVDMTQSIGKTYVDLKNIDLASISAHKFYGLKGIGILMKKEGIQLEPLIHGGKSTTVYRSGTPALPLIVSTAKAMRLAMEHLTEKNEKIEKLSTTIKNALQTYPQVTINSREKSIPHTINFSLGGMKPETFLHALEEHEIYISTKSACSSANTISKAVYALTNDEAIAYQTLRISLSYLTTEEEITTFLTVFNTCFQQLSSLGGTHENN